MSRFRKRPVVIDAAQWFKNGDHPLDGVGMEAPCGNGRDVYIRQEGLVVRFYRHPGVPGDSPCEQCGQPHHMHGWIDTLEQGHRVCPGDWIITGVKGERYPCKPDIFAMTYEPEECVAAAHPPREDERAGGEVERLRILSDLAGERNDLREQLSELRQHADHLQRLLAAAPSRGGVVDDAMVEELAVAAGLVWKKEGRRVSCNADHDRLMAFAKALEAALGGGQ
jgi:hypothetical protein